LSSDSFCREIDERLERAERRQALANVDKELAAQVKVAFPEKHKSKEVVE
jgi:hypothetical protein